MPGTLPICNVFIIEEKSSQVELNTNTEPPRIRHSINCFGTFRSCFFFFVVVVVGFCLLFFKKKKKGFLSC